MSEDSFTEVTHKSWFSRIGEAFKGILLGLILFIAAFPLLSWNEGRAVERHKTLQEGSGVVTSISSEQVEPTLEGTLIHVTGRAVTEETLRDAVFGISANALKLHRSVEMYQWDEDKSSKTKKKLGGGTKEETTYTYRKVWSSRTINSSAFHKPGGHENPGAMPYKSNEWTANEVLLGAFTLSRSLVSKINNYSDLSAEAVPDALKEKVALHDGGFYVGQNPRSPQIGDVRITFETVPHTEVSIVSKQIANSFEPFTADAGGTIELLQVGTHSAEAMFEKAEATNRLVTWGLRALGFFIMFMGLSLIFKPLSVLADVIPLVGTIVGAGTGLIAFLLAGVLSCITIAIAWLVYRPVLGISLLVVAAALIILTVTKARKAKTKT